MNHLWNARMWTNVKRVKQIAILQIKCALIPSDPLSAWTFWTKSVNVKTDLDIKRESINVLVSFKSFSFCYKLYIFFTIIISIKDINECSEAIDDCNRQTQLCLNTPGGYRCQDKVTENCIPGLSFNTETSLCEGALLLPASLIFNLSLNWVKIISLL